MEKLSSGRSPPSQHHSTIPPGPGVISPSSFLASQSGRRTSAPAVRGCTTADHAVPRAADDFRLRSRSLSGSSSSPPVDPASSRGLPDGLVVVGPECVDRRPAFPSETLFVQLPSALDHLIPPDVYQRIGLLLHSYGNLRSA